MKVSITLKENYAILKPDVLFLSREQLSSLKSALEGIVSDGYENVIFDLGLIDNVDSGGLSALLNLNRIASEYNVRTIFTNPSKKVGHILRISHLTEILEIRVNLWDAIGVIIAGRQQILEL